MKREINLMFPLLNVDYIIFNHSLEKGMDYFHDYYYPDLFIIGDKGKGMKVLKFDVNSVIKKD